MKIDQRILSHEGDTWRVVGHDIPRAGYLTIEHHSGARFHIHRSMLKHYGKRLRFWHKFFGKVRA